MRFRHTHNNLKTYADLDLGEAVVVLIQHRMRGRRASIRLGNHIMVLDVGGVMRSQLLLCPEQCM